MDQIARPAALGGVRVPVWSVFLMLAVAGTVLPYLLGLLSLKGIPATTASVLATVEPLVAGALAWILPNETLDWAQLIGVAVLLTGAVTV